MPDDNWGVRTVVDFTTDSNVSPFTVTGVVKTIKENIRGMETQLTALLYI